jgi:hypothetical protein
MSKLNALQTGKFYKVKNSKKNFLCALCSAPRQMKYSKNLSGKQYLQIIVLSITTSWGLFPLIGPKALTSFFAVWMMVELVNKVLYRKGIPCPYCGFDATWYRRDVNVANKKVKDFWNDNYPELVNKIDEEPIAETVPPLEVTEQEALRQNEAM